MKKLFITIFWLLFVFAARIVFAEDMSDWGKFANSIQYCMYGTFNLPEPLQMNVSQPPQIVTFKIIGRDTNGNCKVTITRTVTMPGETQPRLLNLNCSFPSTTLGALTQASRNFATGNAPLSNDPSSKIISSYCK